jgi:hypothetical protein
LAIKDYIPADEIVEEAHDIEKRCGYKAVIINKNKFKIYGFTKIISDGVDHREFINELRADGRLDLIKKYRKQGAPLLAYDSHDMDSLMRGGWRHTVCLAENDITDLQAFLEHDLYVETIDASKWLKFEYRRGSFFDGHGICMKAGYTWNGVISGAFHAFMGDSIISPDPDNEKEMNRIVYCWYPIK